MVMVRAKDFPPRKDGRLTNLQYPKGGSPDSQKCVDFMVQMSSYDGTGGASVGIRDSDVLLSLLALA